MQIKIKLRARQNIDLPIAYRYGVQSMIYSVLKICPEYSDFLHNNGFSKNGNTAFKLFTFSELKGNYSVINKRIIFNDDICFEIRCCDNFMCGLLLEGFKSGNKVRLLNNELTVVSSALENRVIFNDCVTVKTLTPITVLTNTSDKHTLYLSPEEPAFYEKIISNAQRKWSIFFDEADFRLNISPADDARFNKLVTQFKGTYINAWRGKFILSGNPKTIDMLYNCGLGNKNSQGFGMFEVLS